jgi:transcriptional regulator with XRE-family HTH domain
VKVIEAIAKRIQNILSKKKLSQYAVCKKATLHDSTIYNIYHGNQKHLSVNVLLLLCEGMDVSIVEFFSDPLFAEGNLDID